jgi:hypothetical protein
VSVIVKSIMFAIYSSNLNFINYIRCQQFTIHLSLGNNIMSNFGSYVLLTLHNTFIMAGMIGNSISSIESLQISLSLVVKNVSLSVCYSTMIGIISYQHMLRLWTRITRHDTSGSRCDLEPERLRLHPVRISIKYV